LLIRIDRPSSAVTGGAVLAGGALGITIGAVTWRAETWR
jgi:hypothetical protein